MGRFWQAQLGGLGRKENRASETRWWPTEQPKSESFALYVCGCGFTAKTDPSFTFTRVAHFCVTGDSARMVA